MLQRKYIDIGSLKKQSLCQKEGVYIKVCIIVDEWL